MKPTPLLDFWQKPADAGAPVALLATTFALEPDFFEQNCLARFLEVSSVDEDTGSIEDIVASVELHELLQNVRVTVLADRSAPVQRTSLLWDLLSCKVDGGLLHAKVTVLIWEKATRVILGSANLTAAGYRRQIELALAADLGRQCLFPSDVLTSLAGELESYLDLVPGYDPTVAVFKRAKSTLELFKQRIGQNPSERSAVRTAFAPTNETAGPLDYLAGAWNGSKPLFATHLSPFWDSKDTRALTATQKMLTGQPATARSQSVAVVLGPRGQNAFSKELTQYIKSTGQGKVKQLRELDKEVRTLHAKCLLMESEQWVAALVGSSNHTKAGLGLATNRHREMNVWLGAPRKSKEGRELRALVQLGDDVPADAQEVESKDEDEVELPALPACFGLCRLIRSSDDDQWNLHLGIASATEPAHWEISLTRDSQPLLTKSQWEADGAPATVVVPLRQESLPMVVMVRWAGNVTPWAVIADNPQGLPPGPMLAGLRAEQLLEALATGKSLSQLLREKLESNQTDPVEADTLDPLKRFEVQGALLRKGRALAASLSAMQRRLNRPVMTVEALGARLAGPLGPTFVSTKVTESHETGRLTRAEAIFTLAEIALVIGRVNWSHVFEQLDRNEGLRLVKEHLSLIDTLRKRIDTGSDDLSSYARRAIEGAHVWLAS